MSFPRISRWLARPEVALDLGTSARRCFVPGIGLLSEPAPAASAWPVRRGVVVDLDAATEVLRPVLRDARRFRALRSHVLACLPSSASAANRALLTEACTRAGALGVTFVNAAVAGAVGAGLDPSSRFAQMIVDVGEGLTEVVVVRDGAVVAARTIPIAIVDCRRAIRAHLLRARRFAIDGERADGLLRLVLARAEETAADGRLRARGIAAKSGRSRTASIATSELERALAVPLAAIAGCLRGALTDLPAELGCEIIEGGILVTGGGAAFPAVLRRLAAETDIDVRAAADPTLAAIRGAARLAADGRAETLGELGGDAPLRR